MSKTNCLNCGKVLTDKFCSGCGQKADTHRITFKNFIFHDVLHGTFHLDKGILFTAKQALTRPGQAALDYIAGKRKPFYNVFYLILITIGLMLFTRHIGDSLNNQDETITQSKEYINEASRKIDEIFAQKNKIIIFLFVPFAAINSFILFKRKKLNLSEHAIIAGMILLGILLITTFSNLLFWSKTIQQIGLIISYLSIAFIIFQIVHGYYNAFAEDYSKLGISFRIILFFVMISIEILILTWILIGFVTHWKFGEIQFTPFG
jgi:hypothetical protein